MAIKFFSSVFHCSKRKEIKNRVAEFDFPLSEAYTRRGSLLNWWKDVAYYVSGHWDIAKLRPPPPYLLSSQLLNHELSLSYMYYACPNQRVNIESPNCFLTVLGSLCLYKTRSNHQQIFFWAQLEKSQLGVTMKVVVFFDVLGAIGGWFCSYFLNKLSKKAQIKVPEE